MTQFKANAVTSSSTLLLLSTLDTVVQMPYYIALHGMVAMVVMQHAIYRALYTIALICPLTGQHIMQLQLIHLKNDC